MCILFCIIALGIVRLLNYSIYKAISIAGVYYGFKLGRSVEWCYSFPFNMGLRHPQYIGSVLSWTSITVFFLVPSMVAGLIANLLVVIICYAITSVMEQISDSNVVNKSKSL